MPKILIIDDNDDMRETLTLLLEDEGFAAITASDGQSGIDAFSESRPDLVLTDVIMPDCDGIEAIRRIRAIDPSTRIIAMSGGSLISNDSYLRAAHAFGAMAVLPKPFEVEDLVQIVRRCLAEPPPAMPSPG